MSTKKTAQPRETDSVYFLKILLFFLVGSIWLRLTFIDIPIPVGLAVGLLFASHEHFQIDRKIEYAILLIATILSLVAPVGIVLELA